MSADMQAYAAAERAKKAAAAGVAAPAVGLSPVELLRNRRVATELEPEPELEPQQDNPFNRSVGARAGGPPPVPAAAMPQTAVDPDGPPPEVAAATAAVGRGRVGR